MFPARFSQSLESQTDTRGEWWAVEPEPDQLNRGRGTHAGKKESTTGAGSAFDGET